MRVWWLLTWRGFCGAVLFGFPIGFLGSWAGMSSDTIRWCGVIAAVPWGVLVLRMALRKRYGRHGDGFRLALVPVATPVTALSPYVEAAIAGQPANPLA